MFFLAHSAEHSPFYISIQHLKRPVFSPVVFIIQYMSALVCRVTSKGSGHCPKEAACQGREGGAVAIPLW